MKRFVEGMDRGQSTLFPECLEDWVDENNPARVIDMFVDELDLGELGFDGIAPEATGRPSYHPSVLLKLYIYGYLNRVQSSRRLEREAGRNVEVMWLTGRLTPDHKTIADFRRDNGGAIRKVCARFIMLCRRLDLFAGASIVIDGSKFKAVNNRDRNFTRAKMERRLAQIEESVARYLQQLDSADRQEPSEARTAKTVRLKEKIAKLKEEVKRLHGLKIRMLAAPDQQISLTDPDSRSMATSGRGSGVVGYNVQVAVDTAHHLIITHEVTNVGSDRAQLAHMAKQTKATLEATNLDVIADRGYFSGEEILACGEGAFIGRGHAYGGGIFMQGNGAVHLGTGSVAGQVTTINGEITDETGSSGQNAGQSTVFIEGAGAVVLSMANLFTNSAVLNNQATSGTLDLSAVGAAGDAVEFEAPATLRLENAAFSSRHFGATIIGFGYADVNDIPGLAFAAGAQAQYNTSTHALVVSSGGNSLTLDDVFGPALKSFSAISDGTGGTEVVEALDAAAPGGTSAAMVMRNSSTGQFEIYDVGHSAILGAAALGYVEIPSQQSQWQFVGLGTFSSTDTDDMVIRNTTTGAFELYDVNNNNFTAGFSIGQVGPEWSVAGFGQFSSRSGETDMLMATAIPVSSRFMTSATTPSRRRRQWARSAWSGRSQASATSRRGPTRPTC